MWSGRLLFGWFYNHFGRCISNIFSSLKILEDKVLLWVYFSTDLQSDLHELGAHEGIIKLLAREKWGYSDAFTENAEWDLLEARVFNETQIFTFTPDERYPVIGFSLKLKRISTYYVYNIIIPVLILTLLSCLVYVMPSETGEKVGLQVTILLSFSVMLLVMGDTTPKAGKTTPLISKSLRTISISRCHLTSKYIHVIKIRLFHYQLWHGKRFPHYGPFVRGRVSNAGFSVLLMWKRCWTNNYAMRRVAIFVPFSPLRA